MPEPDAAPRVRFLLSTLPPPASGLARFRRIAALIAATVGPLAAATLIMTSERNPPPALWVPSALLALSALLAHHGRVGSQIVARSVWWANLLLGVLLVVAGSSMERMLGLQFVLATGIPLLAMGRMGLDEDAESAFRPVAFRTTLSLGMIMAVADAQALVFWGALKLGNQWNHGLLPAQAQGAILLFAAGLVGVAIIGLYRLRVWGLLLSAACAAGLIVLAATDVCGLERPLPHFLIATSIAQIALPIPILVAVARGRAPERRAPSRLAQAAPAIVVGALMSISLYAVLIVDRRLFR